MAHKANLQELDKLHMERRVIRVECLPDQAGIASALRRAFAAGPSEDEDSSRMFEDLLRRLHKPAA
jgi:hypothetical protein